MKKFSRIIAFVILGAFLSACAGISHDTDEKSIFSAWKRVPDGSPFNISKLSFNKPSTYTINYKDDSRCICDLVVVGNNSSGTLERSGCTYIIGTGSGNPGCTTSNGIYSYTLQNSTLKITSPNGGVATYR